MLDDMNLDLNEGVTGQDIPNNLVVSGMARVPRTGGLTVSWVARALSGTPFTLTDGTLDPDRTAHSQSHSRPEPTRAPAPMRIRSKAFEASAMARGGRASSSSTCGLATTST